MFFFDLRRDRVRVDERIWWVLPLFAYVVGTSKNSEKTSAKSLRMNESLPEKPQHHNN